MKLTRPIATVLLALALIATSSGIGAAAVDSPHTQSADQVDPYSIDDSPLGSLVDDVKSSACSGIHDIGLTAADQMIVAGESLVDNPYENVQQEGEDLKAMGQNLQNYIQDRQSAGECL